MLSALGINDQTPIRFHRNTPGQITAEQLTEQLARTYRYDEEGRLVRQRIQSNAHEIERRFDYDITGNLTARHDSEKGAWHFTYDPMGRVTESIDPMDRVNQHIHDPAGDLLYHLPEPQNGLRAASYNGHTYRFDAAGNLAERTAGTNGLSPQHTTRFQWDDQNRLRTARTQDDTTVEMAYDALGRRTRKSVNGERTFFAWDGDALLAEQFEDQPAREYVYYPGTFEPLALIEGDGQVYYYHNDPNGLPQELSKANGDIVWSALYDAQGRITKLVTDDIAQPLRMQGQYFDPEIDLCYNRHRYFDPLTCSFISQDPLGLAAGENVYAYAPNIFSWVDPLGLCMEISKGTAKVHWYDNRGPGNAFGHYSIEVSKDSKTIHTHQLGAPGTDTMISSDFTGLAPPTKSKIFDLPDAAAAQKFQTENIDKLGPPYDTKTRSCVTHVGEVLREGGMDVPKSPGAQFKFLKRSGL